MARKRNNHRNTDGTDIGSTAARQWEYWMEGIVYRNRNRTDAEIVEALKAEGFHPSAEWVRSRRRLFKPKASPSDPPPRGCRLYEG